MPAFLYTFGFESPRQTRNNRRFEWDDEDSQEILIDAPDEAAALVWGREISERFIKLLFRDEKISWRALGYGNWTSPPDGFSDVPQVGVGEYPDFTLWLKRYEDELR